MQPVPLAAKALTSLSVLLRICGLLLLLLLLLLLVIVITKEGELGPLGSFARLLLPALLPLLQLGLLSLTCSPLLLLLNPAQHSAASLRRLR